MPASQLVHVTDEPAPVALEYVPAGQFVHTIDDVAAIAVENSPARQPMQLLDDGAPKVDEYVPATQLAQVLASCAAVAAENRPAAHCVHVDMGGADGERDQPHFASCAVPVLRSTLLLPSTTVMAEYAGPPLAHKKKKRVLVAVTKLAMGRVYLDTMSHTKYGPINNLRHLLKIKKSLPSIPS